MKKFRSISEDLAMDVYYDPEYHPAMSAIFVGGFPSFPAQNAIISYLAKHGYVVYQPHYYGTFDSNREFSFDSMVQSVVDASFLIGAKLEGAKSDFVAPAGRVCNLLVGHSFGGIAAAYAAGRMDDLENLVIVSSGLRYSTKLIDTGVNENFTEHLQKVRKSWRNSYRLSHVNHWEFVISGELPEEARRQHKTLKKVSVLIGDKDPYFNAEIVFSTNDQVLRAIFGKSIIIDNIVIPGAGHPVESIADSANFESIFSRAN